MFGWTATANISSQIYPMTRKNDKLEKAPSSLPDRELDFESLGDKTQRDHS